MPANFWIHRRNGGRKQSSEEEDSHHKGTESTEKIVGGRSMLRPPTEEHGSHRIFVMPAAEAELRIDVSSRKGAKRSRSDFRIFRFGPWRVCGRENEFPFRASCTSRPPSKVGSAEEARVPRSSPPNALIGGPVRIPPGFPLKACGNDGMVTAAQFSWLQASVSS